MAISAVEVIGVARLMRTATSNATFCSATELSSAIESAAAASSSDSRSETGWPNPTWTWASR